MSPVAAPRHPASGPLRAGLIAGGAGGAALCLFLRVRDGSIPWFSVSYNLPISLAFLALCTHLARRASLLTARAFLREEGPVLLAWSAGGILLFLRLGTRSIDVSGHVVWALLMGVQCVVQGFPAWFTAFVGAILVQVLGLKFLVLGGDSGLHGLVVGSCLGALLWLLAWRSARNTGQSARTRLEGSGRQQARGDARMQTIYPILRYNDARGAIEFLCAAFGFTPRFSVPDSGPIVRHAQLRLGSSLIMLGSVRPDEGMDSPQALGTATQALYVHVEDLDVHFERARRAGAEILDAPRETDFGSRDYHARDPEGHLWTFGTYLPVADLEPGP